ncbi:hypothetical protein AHAS_Ahas09G0302700 [Arachis hypogaea]
MQCASTVSFNVIWNGNKTEEFIPRKGLRQGDPISPYLFVMCMDKLSHLIEQNVLDGEWKPIEVGRDGPKISHLMFADNLLFAEATQDQMATIKCVLETFCNASGLKINEDKTAIVFSKGRLTLAQSTMSPILNYQMQHEKVPKRVCREVERLQRNFIWGDEPNKKRLHLIGWKTMCLPRHKGGLGFRKLSSMNDAFLIKILWQMDENSEQMWVKVLKHKYCDGNLIDDDTQSRNTDSSFWREVLKMWPTFQANTVKFIGNGRGTRFWHDHWLEGAGALQESAKTRISDSNSLVSEWVEENGEWNRRKLNTYLPEEIVQKITATYPPHFEADEDRKGWKHNEDGDFSIASTYKALNNWSKTNKTIWSHLWSWKGPQRVKVFMWTVMHKRTLTNQIIARLFGGNGYCKVCQGVQEDLLHLLRDCPKASTIWVNFLNPMELQKFFSLNWGDWVEANLRKQLGQNQNIDWKDIYMVTCSKIWFWRNKENHEDNYRRPIQPYREIIKEIQEINKAFEKAYLVGKVRARRLGRVAWKPLPKGWLKLNVDGASVANAGKAGCGGLLRDENGKWVAGFTHTIGNSAFITEL